MIGSPVATPQGGRLCRRALTQGSILVGVLHLPEGFSPTEGACYALMQAPEGLRLDTAPVSPGLPEHLQSYGVSDLLHQQIWHQTASPAVMTVRFTEAFPKDGVWTVYGASNHNAPATDPDHAWFDVQADGRLAAIPAPFDATGSGVGQLLSANPVWPDRTGELHTLPQLQSSWRPHFLAYHRLLIHAARDPEVAATLEATVRKNPVFREISIGSIDRDYCAFLAHLDDQGLVGLDAPRTAAACAQRDRASRDFLLLRKAHAQTLRKTAHPR